MTMPDSAYHSLREQIQGILSEGQLHSRKATDWEKVETYWQVGDALLGHISAQPRADYGKQVIPNLGKDLALSTTLLWDVLRFRRLVTILHPRGELTWSHYKRLIYLPSQDQFRFYERQADRGRWSVRQLEDAIRAGTYGAAATQPLAVPLDQDPDAGQPALRPRFGPLHVYQTRLSKAPRSADLYLDLGFGMTDRVDLTGIDDPRPDLLVTSHRHPDGRYTFSLVPRGTRRYTYVAWPQRIIDGDTLVAVADPGLGHQTTALRFRLRGIDAPELSLLAGRNARTFVTDALAQVEFVIVTTYSTDNFGRYLVDVRYLPGEADPDVVRAKGVYLNRQLLDERLAWRYPR